ncbi:MAG: NAD-dependent epimerase/dehydratase family protein [Bacteroidota bacterium]
MNIFLTGGSGFVGQNLIPFLKNQGHEIYALVRSSRSAEKVQSLGAVPVMDDLKNLSKNTAHALSQCEAVVHSAAHMDFTYDPKPYYSINVEATESLLQKSRDAGIRKFIYISAAPVVPGSPIVNMTEALAREGLPQALYPKTKAIAEKKVLAANSEKMKTISLRPPTIWGPNNHHYEDFFDNIKQGRWRWIGGGRQILSTIHVDNLASAILSAIHSDKGGEAYFVTDGDRRSMRETFSEIIKAYGLDPGEKELPRSIAVILAHVLGGIWKTLGLKSRPPVAPLMIRLMATEFSVSDAKARRELGYKNVINFEEGISKLNPA